MGEDKRGTLSRVKQGPRLRGRRSIFTFDLYTGPASTYTNPMGIVRGLVENAMRSMSRMMFGGSWRVAGNPNQMTARVPKMYSRVGST